MRTATARDRRTKFYRSNQNKQNKSFFPSLNQYLPHIPYVASKKIGNANYLSSIRLNFIFHQEKVKIPIQNILHFCVVLLFATFISRPKKFQKSIF
jgi:hypothetical protein